ncbi:hypothetical protein [Schumannella soli]|uniref:Uncharacterized protein n=1 Tax=Schumannella soli TaxID=2590779 RepID=A0A506XS65_9MICO|nr:hypothetical protein [Schumannella soli]TPW75481.1 hypothetical protein FJ657_06185 [Schumannella soli]
MTISRPVLITGAALSLLLLAGCAASPSAAPSDSAKTSRSASASGSASPSADPNELFRITAVLVTPDGAHVEFTETATSPTTATAADTKLLATAECGDQLAATADPVYVHITATSRVVSGTAPDPHRDAVALHGGQTTGAATLSPTAFGGSWTHGQAYCADGSIAMPGTATGVTVYPGAAQPTDAGGWASGSWGFVGARDAESDDVVMYTVASCTVDLGPAAPADLGPTWTTPDTQDGCTFGASV